MSSEISPLVDPEGLVGRVLAERYLLEARLGEGGMGSVYRATHVKMGRDFAIKILHPELLRNEKVVWRFEREAEAAARMRHPNVVPALDVGTTEEGFRYLVMDFVDGPDLATVMLEAPMPPPRVISLVRQICEGLQHAHSHGLIHRDLKPQNIIVETDAEGREVPRIVDFGISILASDEEDESSRLTTNGMVLGTPLYMAPEQAVAGEIDHRVDLFALGLIVYEMVSGALPFDGTGAQVARANLMLDPPPMNRRVPDLSVDPLLEAFTRRLMQRDRDRRPGSAREARELLDLIERDRKAAAAMLGIVNDVPPSQVMTVPRLPSVSAGERPSARQLDRKALGGAATELGSAPAAPPLVVVNNEEGAEVVVSLSPLGEGNAPPPGVAQAPSAPLTAPVQPALPLPYFPGDPPPMVAQPWQSHPISADRRAERYLTTEHGYRHASPQRRRWVVVGVFSSVLMAAAIAVLVVSSGPTLQSRAETGDVVADPAPPETKLPDKLPAAVPDGGVAVVPPAPDAAAASTAPDAGVAVAADAPADAVAQPPSDAQVAIVDGPANPPRVPIGGPRTKPRVPVTPTEPKRPDFELKPVETPKNPETPKGTPPPTAPVSTANMTLTAKYKAVGVLLNKLPKGEGQSLWASYSRIKKDEAAADPELRRKTLEQLAQIERDINALLKK